MSRGPSVSSRDIEAVVETVSRYEHGISRAQLVAALNATHRRIGDSATRVAIEGARAAGHPLIWKDKKYRMARSWDELNDWIGREPEPRIRRMAEQVRAMRARGVAIFPPQQLTLSEAA